MQEFREITEIHGNKADILFKRTSACGRCGACGMLANMDEITIQAENTLNAKVGDQVLVEFSDASAMKASALAYLIPLAMLFIGVLIGYYMNTLVLHVEEGDVVAALSGVVFTAIGFLILKFIDPKFKKNNKYMYKMVEIKQNNQE